MDTQFDGLLFTGSRPAAQGRARGMPNFKADEDMFLALAYIVITTDAAVGTDQDGATFWSRIRNGFVRRGGHPGRTAASLMNRFNKVLQAEVNKYVAFLTDVLREYHSGWALTDYTAEANRMFLIKHGKAFKHEVVYNILKKILPKYEINIGVVNAQVSRALLMCDDHRANEDEENVEPSSEEGSAIGTAIDSTSAPFIGMCTPRPTMGKKKAKNFDFNRNKQNAPPLPRKPSLRS